MGIMKPFLVMVHDGTDFLHIWCYRETQVTITWSVSVFHGSNWSFFKTTTVVSQCSMVLATFQGLPVTSRSPSDHSLRHHIPKTSAYVQKNSWGTIQSSNSSSPVSSCMFQQGFLRQFQLVCFYLKILEMGMSENRVYSQWNSHLVGIMISKTIGYNGVHYFQTNPNEQSGPMTIRGESLESAKIPRQACR